MDTSETYVKMCEKAPQLLQEWTDRDLYAYAINEKDCPHRFTDVRIYLAHEYDSLPKEEAFHVYRQDQLQTMLSLQKQADIFAWDEMGWGINDNPRGETWKFWEDFDNGKLSWEQIWLRFVMQELFSKTWNGQDWVKEG